MHSGEDWCEGLPPLTGDRARRSMDPDRMPGLACLCCRGSKLGMSANEQGSGSADGTMPL